MDYLSTPGSSQQQIPQYQDNNESKYQDPNDIRKNAYVKITEQPAPRSFKFRYESEGRFIGSISGKSSNAKTKTHPSIQVVGYVGKAYVVVSCVTKDYPHRPHPHHISGKTGCKAGVCRVDIPPDTMSVTFSNIAVRCVRKKEIEESLRLRKIAKVDPFQTGFDQNKPTPIDVNAVRLCFQVIVQTDNKNIPLIPVVSDPIYNKRGHNDLIISKLSDCMSEVDGGKKDVILLCGRVATDDIQIRFFEQKENEIVWEYLYDVPPAQVHRKVAIIFRAPPYHKLDVTEPVDISIQLRRPSDGEVSDPVPFQLLPTVFKKRKKHANLNLNPLLWETSKPTTMDVGNVDQMYHPTTINFSETSGQSMFNSNIPEHFSPLSQTSSRKSSSGFNNETRMGQQFPFVFPQNNSDIKTSGFQNPAFQSNHNLLNIHAESEESKPQNIILPLSETCSSMNTHVLQKMTASSTQIHQNWQPSTSNAPQINNYAQNVLQTNGLNTTSHKWDIVSHSIQDNLNFELPKWNTGGITDCMNVLSDNMQMPTTSQDQTFNGLSHNLCDSSSSQNTANFGATGTNNNSNTTNVCNILSGMEMSTYETVNNLSQSLTNMSLENMSCDSLTSFLNAIEDTHLKSNVGS